MKRKKKWMNSHKLHPDTNFPKGLQADSHRFLRFMRVHKSYIVPLNRIDSVEHNRIYIGKAIILIGDPYRNKFFRRIDG